MRHAPNDACSKPLYSCESGYANGFAVREPIMSRDIIANSTSRNKAGLTQQDFSPASTPIKAGETQVVLW
jgi:hypothetical protein